MPNSRRSSHEASRSDHTLVGAESSRRREVRILSVRLKKESLPLESTVWWMLLCAVSHYHRRQPDARRMEMGLRTRTSSPAAHRQRYQWGVARRVTCFRDESASREGGVMTGLGSGGVRPWRLGARTRKAVLVVHIVSAGVWIGIDVVMGVVIFIALLADDGNTKALCYQALELFAVWPLLTTGLVCLASGVVLGLGTKYGLVRYWWVAIKLVLNIVLTALVLVALRPEIGRASEQGRRFMAGEAASLAVGDLIYPPIVSPSALLIAVVLAVFKPWGKIRKRRRPQGDPR